MVKTADGVEIPQYPLNLEWIVSPGKAEMSACTLMGYGKTLLLVTSENTFTSAGIFHRTRIFYLLMK